MEQRHTYKEPVSPVFFNNVSHMAFVEDAALDPDPMLELFTKLGEDGAERAITRSLHDIARDLEQVRLCATRDTWGDAGPALRGLVHTAAHIGLTGVSRVASDVLVCVAEKDRAGIAATAARLTRLGDQALSELWNAPEHLI